MAGQVDGNVDLKVTEQGGGDLIGRLADVDEPVECGFHPRPHRAVAVPAPRQADGLDARTVMGFEYAREQVGDRVGAEVAADVGHLQSVAVRSGPVNGRAGGRGVLICGIGPRTAQLRGGGCRDAKK